MSRFHGPTGRWRYLVMVLFVVGTVLVFGATSLAAWPLPFRVPPVLVLLPDISGAALVIVAMVITLRELPRLP